MKISQSNPITVIGIDPGYDRVGWAIGTLSNTFTLIDTGCIQTQKNDRIFERYQHITAELTALVAKYHPTEVAIETLFFSKNTATAMRVSEARGIILACLLREHCHIFEYNPVEIKQAVTGNGVANKTAVEKMVRMQTTLPQNKRLIDDAIDAIAVSITHAVKGRITKLTSRLA